MSRQAARLACAACDHALVSGVACDGQFEEWCEYLEVRSRVVQDEDKQKQHLYLVEIADLAAPDEFDAVRSET